MRVALVQFIYESNTFSEEKGTLELFEKGGLWVEGEAAVRRWAAGTRSQMQGSLRVLEAAGVETVPCFSALCGSPSGRLTGECHTAIEKAMIRCLSEAEPYDGLILHLHGAACAEGEDDIEGSLLEKIRHGAGPEKRIILSLDLHANITRRMMRNVDGMTAYRTMPHRDFMETGERAARLFLHPGELTCKTVKIGALIPPTDTSDLEGPFSVILQRARELESREGVLDIGVFPVQPWLDVEELGSAIVATVDPSHEGRPSLLRAMAEEWYGQRHSWRTHLQEWDEILNCLPRKREDGPWILVDTADATSGGASGRSPEALRQLLPHRDALPGEVFLWVVCPETVEAARCGASTFKTGRPPVAWRGEVLRTGEGRFCARGSAYTGESFSMGSMAVIAVGKLRVVACEFPALVSDPAFYECVGLEPEKALAVLAKSMAGWMAGYQCLPDRGLLFGKEGVTSLNFANLPFTRCVQGVFPLHPEPEHPIELWT